MATINSVVATGRRMKISEGFIAGGRLCCWARSFRIGPLSGATLARLFRVPVALVRPGSIALVLPRAIPITSRTPGRRDLLGSRFIVGDLDLSPVAQAVGAVDDDLVALPRRRS